MTPRSPDTTRHRILQSAAKEIHTKGFQAASVDAILEETGLTKGALYHHFGSKEALGTAVITEVIGGFIRSKWIEPLRDTDDPLPALVAGVRMDYGSIPDEIARCGCPLNNLNQEMSSQNDALRSHIDEVYLEWRSALEEAFRRGQRAGKVRADVDAAGVAKFFVAVHQGCASLMKAAGAGSAVDDVIPILLDYLRTLEPSTVRS